MSTANSPTYTKTPMAGEYGNKSFQHDTATLVSTVNGKLGDVINMGVIPGGAKVLGFREAHAALNATVTISYGWSYVDGTAGGSATALLAATAANAAGGTVNTGLVPFTVDKDINVYATVGGAAADGQIDCVIDYHFSGTK